MTDPVELTRDLIRCASVTPDDDGAIPLLERYLEEAGFEITRADRGGILNLIAVWNPGANGPVLGFNGHTDVVPVGDEAAWTKPPFGAEIHDGVMFGRGTTDMKSGVAAFAAAAVDVVRDTALVRDLIV